MTIASKFTLALLACVIVAVMGYATWRYAASWPARSRTSSSTRRRRRMPFALRFATCGCTTEKPVRSNSSTRHASACAASTSGWSRSTRPRPRGSVRASLRPGWRASRTIKTSSWWIERSSKQGRIFTYVRVHLAAAPIAAIEVSQSLAGHSAVRAEVLRSAGLTALLIAVASGFVTSFLGLALVGRPLAALVAQARRIGEGDLSYRIAISRRDEIAELGHEMNRMCERLRDSRESERAQTDAKMHALSQLRHADRLATVGGSRPVWRTSSGRRSTSSRPAPGRWQAAPSARPR